MRLPYSKIFKQAWEIVKSHKFLWIFGLFLVWGNLFSFIFSNQLSNREPIIISNQLAIFMFALTIVLAILFFRAKAGMIAAVQAVIDQQPTSFSLSFAVGRLFFWRLVWLSILMGIILVIVSVIVAMPIMYLISLQLMGRALILGLLGIVILIPLMVVAALIGVLGSMYIVLFDQKIEEAIKNSFNLLSAHWVRLIIFSFFLFLATLAATLIISPFVILAIMSYHIIVAILGSIVFLSLQALVAAWSQAAWVLFFLELIRPQKLEEEEPAAVPEIV
jgi:hypothetical protein